MSSNDEAGSAVNWPQALTLAAIIVLGAGAVAAGLLLTRYQAGLETSSAQALQTRHQSKADTISAVDGNDEAAKPSNESDLQVSFLAAEAAYTTFMNFFQELDSYGQVHFNVYLKVGNISQSKKHTMRHWHDSKRDVSLTDDLGNDYCIMRLPSGDQPFVSGIGVQGAALTIHPGETITSLIVFERPVKQATTFTLKLPARNIGGTGILSFQFRPSERKNETTPDEPRPEPIPGPPGMPRPPAR